MSETIGNPEMNRSNIERMKEVVNKSGVLLMEESGDKDKIASKVLEDALNIQGVSDIRDLLAATDNRNINQKAVEDKINNFGVAIGECIKELGNEGGDLKEALVAGSFSLEKKLPKAWAIENTDKSGNEISLAAVVCDASVNISNRETKMAIIQATEWIDYGVNHKQDGVTLNEEVNNAIRELDAMGKKSFNNNERAVIRKKLDYLKGLKTNFHSENNSDEITSVKTETFRNKEKKQSMNSYLDEEEEKILAESQYDLEANTRSWDLSPLFMAIDFKYMNGRMGWRLDTPAQWYKDLPREVADRIDVMVTMCQAASGLESAGKDLDYVMKNEAAFKFTNEHMTQLFNGDFKLVMSKMVNDLCEFYPDCNGRYVLRYKEKFYELAKNRNRSREQLNNLISEGRVDKAGFLLDKPGGNRIVMDDIPINRGLGARTIDKDVLENLEHFQHYKDRLAQWLAEQNGNETKKDKDGNEILDKKTNKPIRKLTYMNMFDAYTAWNLVYAMGDTSVWDRMRILPTYNQIISDAVRTLNPEYKARGKMMIEKSGRIKEATSLIEAEYFGGPVAEWAIKVMELERDLGEKILDDNGKIIGYKERPLIPGDKTFREKVLDRQVSLLSNKTFYGFLDFVNGGRDLFYTDTSTGEYKNFYNENLGEMREVTLSNLLMDYAFRDKKGANGETILDKNGRPVREFINERNQREEFSFGDKTTTFQNEFHDMLEGASIMYESMMGKTKDVKADDPKSIYKWGEKIKNAQRMVNGININGKSALLYGRDPNLWRDVIIGTFGCDSRRLSSDHPYLMRPSSKNGFSQAYSDYVLHLLIDTKKLGLTSVEVNVNRLMNLLGVDISPGEDPRSVASRNQKKETMEREQTHLLLEEQERRTMGNVIGKGIQNLMERVSSIDNEINDEVGRMTAEFWRMMNFGGGFEKHANNLVEAIEKEVKRQQEINEKKKNN